MQATIHEEQNVSSAVCQNPYKLLPLLHNECGVALNTSWLISV